LSGNVVVRWNELVLEAAQHAPPSRVPVFRNLALVSVAAYDAVNAIDGSYAPYFAQVQASAGASEEAAAAQAAHDTASVLYPQQRAAFDAELAADLAGIPPGRAAQGIAIGQAVAQQILALRSNDGASAVIPYAPPNQDPGQWQSTPPDFSPATTAHIPLITPFAVPNTTMFGPPPPPALTSQEYADSFNEVKALGSLTSTVRTPDQTQVAFLWRLPLTNLQVWNRIAQDVATRQGATLEQTARLFALLDMTQNDGLETSFTAKYHFALWRPITAIRDPRSSLINPETQSDPTWTTLHPTTPAFPTYPSNAGAEGGTSATILAAFFGTNDIPFEVHWDAYGFPGVTRSYMGFWAAATEEGLSRVYGGIHFPFDVSAGQEIGRQVGDFIFGHFLLPTSESEQGDSTGASDAQTNQGISRELSGIPNIAFANLLGNLLDSRSAPLISSPTVLPTAPRTVEPTIASAFVETSAPAPNRVTVKTAAGHAVEELFSGPGSKAFTDDLGDDAFRLAF
jgi:membrane-associated phospholipid phosphatase